MSEVFRSALEDEILASADAAMEGKNSPSTFPSASPPSADNQDSMTIGALAAGKTSTSYNSNPPKLNGKVKWEDAEEGNNASSDADVTTDEEGEVDSGYATDEEADDGEEDKEGKPDANDDKETLLVDREEDGDSTARANVEAINTTLDLTKSCPSPGSRSPSFSSPFRRMLSPPLPLFSAYKSREPKAAKTVDGFRFLQHGPSHINWHPPELEPLLKLTPNETMYLTEQYKRDLYRNILDKRIVYDSVYTYDELDAMNVTQANNCYSVLNVGFNNHSGKHGTIKQSFYVPKGIMDTTLVFESRFETGNLRRAVQLDEHEYDLMLRPDLKTDFHTQWFYFCVTNTRAGTDYRFNIINHGKSDSMFSKGMRPLMYSVKAAAEQGKGWVRTGQRICYYPNLFKFTRKKKTRGYNSLSFTITMEYSMDAVYFAMCYPYTYSDLGRYFKALDDDPKKRVYVRRRTLCRTLAGNECDMITISHFDSDHEEIGARKAVVATARVHPGETNASWMMKGLIDFLVGDSREAHILRKNFIFKIVPMLNPDGVIHGNYRCSLAGVDLNRVWINPSKALHPTIYYTKEMIKRVAESRQLLMCVDMHGHSTKSNIFCYGCDNKHDRAIKNTERVFPRMLWDNNSNVFSFSDCSFNMSKSKRSTMRIVLRNEIGLINSYTCEASFAGSTTGPNAGNHFTMLHLQRLGYLWGMCILEYCNPEKRLRMLQELELMEALAQNGEVTFPFVEQSDGSGGSSEEDEDSILFGGNSAAARARRRKRRKKKKEKEKKEREKKEKGAGNRTVSKKTKKNNGNSANGSKKKAKKVKRKNKDAKQKLKQGVRKVKAILKMKKNSKENKKKTREKVPKRSSSTSVVTVSEETCDVTVTVTVTTTKTDPTTATTTTTINTQAQQISPRPPPQTSSPGGADTIQRSSSTTKRGGKRAKGTTTTKEATKANRAWADDKKIRSKAAPRGSGAAASASLMSSGAAASASLMRKKGKSTTSKAKIDPKKKAKRNVKKSASTTTTSSSSSAPSSSKQSSSSPKQSPESSASSAKQSPPSSSSSPKQSPPSTSSSSSSSSSAQEQKEEKKEREEIDAQIVRRVWLRQSEAEESANQYQRQKNTHRHGEWVPADAMAVSSIYEQNADGGPSGRNSRGEMSPGSPSPPPTSQQGAVYGGIAIDISQSPSPRRIHSPRSQVRFVGTPEGASENKLGKSSAIAFLGGRRRSTGGSPGDYGYMSPQGNLSRPRSPASLNVAEYSSPRDFPRDQFSSSYNSLQNAASPSREREAPPIFPAISPSMRQDNSYLPRSPSSTQARFSNYQ